MPWIVELICSFTAWIRKYSVIMRCDDHSVLCILSKSVNKKTHFKTLLACTKDSWVQWHKRLHSHLECRQLRVREWPQWTFYSCFAAIPQTSSFPLLVALICPFTGRHLSKSLTSNSFVVLTNVRYKWNRVSHHMEEAGMTVVGSSVCATQLMPNCEFLNCHINIRHGLPRNKQCNHLIKHRIIYLSLN